MLETEFVRSLNHNYERILLDQKPEERKYQYCILSRGGIRGLLSCSLRYINGSAYLYYDITSRQSIAQLYSSRFLTRQWMKDFMWGLGQIMGELERFLLDYRNILWQPGQIFQDLENNMFSFVYVPYYEGEGGFLELLDFWVERIDYEDEALVECVYKMYDRFTHSGEAYLQAQIFEDAKALEQREDKNVWEENQPQEEELKKDKEPETMQKMESILQEEIKDKKGFLHFWDGKKRKNREMRNLYEQEMRQAMSGYAVAEDTAYEEPELGKTIYIETKQEERERTHGLYTREGRLLARLDKTVFSIGKKKSESDLVLEDVAVSRVHARICKEKEGMYLEDMNSTNGTFKNGLRMQPYEKKKLEEEDEIKIGRTVMIYR
ncbi:MAG TPA: FHA domain-containing protein [Candidatus Acetatifactor stercoripullorum]|uniref:FHA domain-containing protein n=1 Tax=Candidatus Acetatifactor stercoripullorum TaxID=2838414 RepID=A0A9D1R847_9FIRM|nr:DUF6382 domain-containing protein [uncultured Acetatifactor sp.]HIW81847.1 FHA domain-containing protein [Candidatus Acetatifactor stercoripullorum]